MNKIITHQRGEKFTHRQLWQFAKDFYDHGQTLKAGEFSFYAGAMLFCFMAFEAYLNYILYKLAPEIYAKERKFSVEGKIEKVSQLCGLETDKDQRPYKTIKQLIEFRHSMAHGKPETIDFSSEHNEDEMPPFFLASFSQYVSAEKAKMTFEDIEKFSLSLYSGSKNNAPAEIFNDPYFQEPFKGPFGYSERLSRVKDNE